jgi:hypothetical protein
MTNDIGVILIRLYVGILIQEIRPLLAGIVLFLFERRRRIASSKVLIRMSTRVRIGCIVSGALRQRINARRGVHGPALHALGIQILRELRVFGRLRDQYRFFRIRDRQLIDALRPTTDVVIDRGEFSLEIRQIPRSNGFHFQRPRLLRPNLRRPLL